MPKRLRSYLPTLSLVLLVVVELLFSVLCCPHMSEGLPYFGSLLKDFDVEAPQDRVLSDVEFVAIVALKAAQATIVATRCDFKHLLLFLISKYTLSSCLNLI